MFFSEKWKPSPRQAEIHKDRDVNRHTFFGACFKVYLQFTLLKNVLFGCEAKFRCGNMNIWKKKKRWKVVRQREAIMNQSAGGVWRSAAVPGILADVILQSAGGVQQPRSWPMALQNRMSETPQAWDFLSRSAAAQSSASSQPGGTHYRFGTWNSLLLTTEQAPLTFSGPIPSLTI